MKDKAVSARFLVRWLDSLALSYRFILSDMPLFSSIQKIEGGGTRILMSHSKYVSVNGVRLVSGTSQSRVGWYDSNKIFIYNRNDDSSIDIADSFKIIDVDKGTVVESVDLYEDYAHSVCSKAMQAFIVGGSDLHVIDIRTKRRLLARLESPLYGLSLFDELPYTVFYLTGRSSLSLRMMDLRVQKEITLCSAMAHLVEHCDLEIYFHRESDALMCMMQSRNSCLIFRDLKATSSGRDRLDSLSAMSQVSSMAKNPNESFTWLHTMLCFEDRLVFPAIVSSISGSRLALLDVSDPIELRNQNQTMPLYSLNSRRNTSLFLESALSRASSTAAAAGVLAAVIDGVAYTAPIS